MRRAFPLAAILACCAGQMVSAQSAASPAPAATAAQAPFVKSEAEQVVAKLADELEANFVFPEIGKQYATMLRGKLAAGAYASFADAKGFADAVTADLQAVHKDGHLRVHVVPSEARSGPQGERRAPSPESAVKKSGWLADGVAYIRFDGFPGNDATITDVRRFLDAHKSARTLIIDARMHRGGGLAEMDVLFPQLFAKPTTLVAMDTRLAVEERDGSPMQDANVRKVAGPEGVARREHFVVPAAQQGGLARAKVYLLTSGRTGSAGEHLALSLKRTKRATLVGETTRGAGHYGGMVPLDETFTYAAFIPVGRTFDPDTGEGWEGTGVKPDVAVPADQALDKALELAGVKVDAKVALAGLR